MTSVIAEDRAAPSGDVVLRLVGARKRLAGTLVLHGLDLEVSRGEKLVVIGPSGSGKSTLLRVLAGLESVDQGTYSGLGPPSAVLATQQPFLFPWLTVSENVRFAGRVRAHRGRFDGAWTARLLTAFGLDDVADSLPDQLSGGQAQRTAVARALAARPEVLLLDEPFGALDPATRAGLRSWLRETADELALTLVVVTHDVDEALYLGDTIVLLGQPGDRPRRWQPARATHAFGNHPLRDELLASFGDAGADR